MSDQAALIQAQGLSVTRGQRTVVENVSLRLEAGQIVTLIGPNGSGKTTLVRTLLGLQRFAAGSIERRHDLRIGYMPQKLTIDATLPLRVERFLQLARSTPERWQRAIESARIEHLLKRPIQQVSGGELQRILLARALLAEPNLMILDEPAQGLDVNAQTEFYRLVKQLRDRYGCGVLMVSHDLHLVMSATDRVLCLNRHICCEGQPEAISQDPAYLTLFGQQGVEQLALYSHHHNHRHDLHGDVVTTDPSR